MDLNEKLDAMASEIEELTGHKPDSWEEEKKGIVEAVADRVYTRIREAQLTEKTDDQKRLEIMNIKDRTKRQKAIGENWDLFRPRTEAEEMEELKGLSRDQIFSIKDTTKRQKAIRENWEALHND